MKALYATVLSDHTQRRMAQLQRRLADPRTLDHGQVEAIFNLFNVVLEDETLWEETVAFLMRFAPIAERHALRGHWNQWLERVAYKAAQVGDSAAEAWMRYYQGTLYKDQGLLQEALPALRRSVECFRQCGDQAGEARALALLAFTGQLAGRLEEAERAVEVVERLDPGPHERAMILSVRGILALRRRAYQEAREHFQASLRAYGTLSDERYRAFGLVNLGTAHRNLGEIAEGDDCYRRAIELAHRTGDQRLEATAGLNRANLYLETEPRKALSYLEGVELILIDTHDLVQLASLCNSRGMACHALGDEAAAIESYERGLSYHESLRQPDRRINLLDNYALSLKAMGRHDEARARLAEAVELLPEITDPQQRAALREMLAQSGAALGE